MQAAVTKRFGTPIGEESDREKKLRLIAGGVALILVGEIRDFDEEWPAMEPVLDELAGVMRSACKALN